MPTYDYKCEACGQSFELWSRITDYNPAPECPLCKSVETKRVFTLSVHGGEAVLLGQFSDNIESDLYNRPDKENIARDWVRDYHMIAKFADRGRTMKIRPIEARMYKARLARYARQCGGVPPGGIRV